MEGQMRAPRFVDDERLAAVVAHLCNGLEVRARAVRTRAHHPGACGIGVFLPRLVDLLGRRWMGEVPVGVPAWGDPSRLDAGEDQSSHDRLVAVSGDQQAPA